LNYSDVIGSSVDAVDSLVISVGTSKDSVGASTGSVGTGEDASDGRFSAKYGYC